MEKYSEYVFYTVTTIATGIVIFIIRWVSKKFRKIDATEEIRAKLDTHVDNYTEFKNDTKSRLTKIEDRAYEQKK